MSLLAQLSARSRRTDMTMYSKYNSSCKSCGFGILIGDPINWSRGYGATHIDKNACEMARGRAEIARAQREVLAPKADLKPIADFLTAAKTRGLKSPKLRVLARDGNTELRLAITKGGIAPGSISVALGGEFIGCVRPTGAVVGKLAGDSEMVNHLLIVSSNPAAAAKEYAAVMGLCSFCGKQLTEEGSVEVGYGPVCADKWGLPHKYKGTKVLGAVPQA